MSEQAALRDAFEKIDTLREENRQLREALSPHISFPSAWGLFPAERAMLAALYARRGLVTQEALRKAACKADALSENVVTVHICRLRQKTKAYGVKIITLHGQGYELTPASREIVKGALAQ